MVNDSLQYEEIYNLSDDNNDLPVIFGFSVNDDIIIDNKSGKTIKNVSIDDLNLSLRSANALKRGNIFTIADLIKLTIGDLSQIHSLGIKSKQEIVKAIHVYLEKEVYDDSQSIFYEKPNIYTKEKESEEDAEYVDINLLVENLPLSTQAINCLIKHKIYDLKTLLELNTENVKSLYKVGIKTTDEIIDYINQNKYLLSIISKNKIKNLNKLNVSKIEIEQKQIEWKNRIKLKDTIFNIFYSHPLFSFTSAALYITVEKYSKIEIFNDILQELVKENKIEITNTYKYRLKCIPVMEYARAEFSNNTQMLDILQERINEKTLEVIAKKYRVSRECIRQQQNKIINNINKKCCNEYKMIYEESFSYLFENYNISKEIFCEITNEPFQTYQYLSLKRTIGKKDLSDILSDINIPNFIKVNYEKFLRFSPKSPYIYIINNVNRRILKKPKEIEKYILSEFCRNDVTVNEYIKLYNDFLKTHNLINDENNLVTLETNSYTLLNYFLTCEYVLYKPGRKIRYYQIQSNDYTELFDTINLEQYQNIEISTLKLFRQHINIMEQYDIRDEYELHNLLKKIGINDKNPTASFEKTPYIKFGEFDRNAMIKEKLFENAPISQEKLTEIIFEEYGYKMRQIRKCFEYIKDYYIDGMFSVDYECLPNDHMKLLKAVLTEPFYYIHEIKKIYSNLIPDANVDLISSFNLKRMGFIVNSNYVIQNFISVKEYFKYLLTSNDTIDISEFNIRYNNLPVYYAALCDLRIKCQIIEYKPNHYATSHYLQKIGITKNMLKDYCENVFNYIDKGTYFTIESLKKTDFLDSLNDFDFDAWFYSSVLRTDKRFKYIKIGGTVLFYKGNESINLCSFLINILSNMIHINLNDLLNLCNKQYNIKLNKDKVKYTISNIGLYFYSVTETIYRDYDTYYQTILENNLS